jgi:predicted GNAT superfamily acetyltransferase
MAAVGDAIYDSSRYAGIDLDHIGPVSAYFILAISRAMVTPLSPFSEVRMRDRELLSITPAEISRGMPLAKTLLALNNAHAQELSWLEPERLQHLVEQAFRARRFGDLGAFLLAFDQDARYDSPNFLWFCARDPRFVYVDRIVVASSARGHGCARRLYRDLFEHAADAGHERVVCEVNSSPPNAVSDAFHAALGFVEVGTASVCDGSRTVRYLSHTL